MVVVAFLKCRKQSLTNQNNKMYWRFENFKDLVAPMAETPRHGDIVANKENADSFCLNN